MEYGNKEERKKIIEEIGKGIYSEEIESVIGENRGQLFIRIPKKIAELLKLKKGNSLIFRIENVKNPQLEVKVKL